jgi:hypothetical protein
MAFDNPAIVGVRATPGFVPAPNSKPLGSKTGAPPRTQFYSRPVIPATMLGQGGGSPTQIVAGTAENRVAILTAPLIGFTVYIGGSGVTPQNGLALTPGLNYEAILPGLQELFAVTDAPVFVPLQVQVAPVLMAERERET